MVTILFKFRDKYSIAPAAHLQKCWLQFHCFPLHSLPISCVLSPYIGNQIDKPSQISKLEQEDKVMTEKRGITPDTCPGEYKVDMTPCEEYLPWLGSLVLP